MKEIEITISKCHIYDKVAMTAAYIGTKTVTNELYDLVAINEEQTEILDKYLIEATSNLVSEIKQFISYTIVGGVVSLSLNVSSSFNENLFDNTNALVAHYLTNMITSKWLMIVKPEAAADYATIASSYLLQVTKNLYHKSPIKRTEVKI